MRQTTQELTKAEQFYLETFKLLKKSGIPFMTGGTFAVNVYTGINRSTKDLDVFCRASDYPKILEVFSREGFKTEVIDERWLARIVKGKNYTDLIFNSAVAANPVTDNWLKESQTGKIYNIEVSVLPMTELIFSKIFIQNRHLDHGNDIAHLILRQHKNIDWKRLLSYMDQNWEILLWVLLRFRFIYPSERELVPKWLLEELLGRLQSQIKLPTSREKVCRGRLLSPMDFEIDVHEWGFTDLIGWKYGQK